MAKFHNEHAERLAEVTTELRKRNNQLAENLWRLDQLQAKVDAQAEAKRRNPK
jgi:hypothetical protein